MGIFLHCLSLFAFICRLHCKTKYQLQNKKKIQLTCIKKIQPNKKNNTIKTNGQKTPTISLNYKSIFRYMYITEENANFILQHEHIITALLYSNPSTYLHVHVQVHFLKIILFRERQKQQNLPFSLNQAPDHNLSMKVYICSAKKF
jgi:hypothetical protein